MIKTFFGKNLELIVIFSIILVWSFNIYGQTSPKEDSNEIANESSTTESESQTKPSTIVNPELSPNTYIQQINKGQLDKTYIKISLSTVIEQGLRVNHDQHIRNFQGELLDLGWKDTRDSFWLPNVQLTLSTDEHRIARLWNGSKNTSPISKSPTGTLQLSFGEYTLFNWGKDYLDYLNSKATYLRSKTVLGEERRELKQDLIIEYFNLVTLSEILNIRRSQLRQASFVYRLNREKVVLRKISKQEYYQSRAEYLRAQNDYYQAHLDLQVANENMVYLMQDPPNTQYVIKEKINYTKIVNTIEELEELAQINNPDILNSKTTLESSQRSYQKIIKSDLPLPKFTINLGAYTNYFGRNQYRTFYETRSGNSDIELVASINATWTILGTNGLINSRRREQSYIDKEISLKSLIKAKDVANSEVRTLYKQIVNLQDQITILEARTGTMRKTFDQTLENYLNRKTAFINFKDTLNERTDSNILYVTSKYYHLKYKVLLAKVIGLEDLPRENFEKLALREDEDK